MGDITVDAIKELREITSCGVSDCKKALEEAKGDFNQAKALLQKRGLELAAKKGSREAKEGRIETYIHPGSKIGVLLELNCETDFVAKNENFINLSKNIAMHIAALNPKYVKKEDVPADELSAQPDQKSYLKEVCLYEQPFVKEPSKTIQDLISAMVASIGENIFISRFVRFKVSES